VRPWSQSPTERVRAAFAFLSEPPHAYRLIAESDSGMAGSVTYRSDALWITVEWDRGEPWLEFAPTQEPAGRFDWELVDSLLQGAKHTTAPVTGPAREAPAEELAAWLRARLPEIEARFTPAVRTATQARLLGLATKRAAARQAWWKARERTAR
jgi:hypothetical protein